MKKLAQTCEQKLSLHYTETYKRFTNMKELIFISLALLYGKIIFCTKFQITKKIHFFNLSEIKSHTSY